MVMGNSVKTWNRIYHLTYKEHRAQAAVDMMAQLRADMHG